MLLFRAHHARMVERMIGRRMGTGGSSGVDYLDATTNTAFSLICGLFVLAGQARRSPKWTMPISTALPRAVQLTREDRCRWESSDSRIRRERF